MFIQKLFDRAILQVKARELPKNKRGAREIWEYFMLMPSKYRNQYREGTSCADIMSDNFKDNRTVALC
ncbi:hypothetical protein D6D85_03490 [Candidatus Methanodesulfokora washburnensis]|uniref:Uncharacterized protein n=1 Tax=Candidatus Methanodesulfokora washburnensis TaxID=2478471 RepID=A0A3R9PKZ8_9CREN|nr:hypothetical protein D6D85_03490 [Candidatus Methanodesulfokores washburnensis]